MTPEIFEAIEKIVTTLPAGWICFTIVAGIVAYRVPDILKVLVGK